MRLILKIPISTLSTSKIKTEIMFLSLNMSFRILVNIGPGLNIKSETFNLMIKHSLTEPKDSDENDSIKRLELWLIHKLSLNSTKGVSSFS